MIKTFLKLFIMIFISQANAMEVFNLYIGSNYISDKTIARFETNCKCDLVASFFNDNEEMLAKIAAGANGYDVIVATSYAVEELAKMGKIREIDHKLLSLKSIDSKFLNKDYDQNNRYSVPYAYTPVFLAYNIEKMKELNITPNTWGLIFDTKYLSKLKGHITVLDSSRNVMAAALLYLHKNPNSEDVNDLILAKALIDKASGYWAKFDSDSYYRALLRGDIWVSMSYSTDIFKVINDSKDVKIAGMLQKEGNMYELDNMVIPISSKNLILDYSFINTVLATQSEYELALFTGASIPSKAALAKLPNRIKNNEWIYPPEKNMYVFNAYRPKTRIFVNELWSEIKMNVSCN